MVPPVTGNSGDKKVALHGQLEDRRPADVIWNSSRLSREIEGRRKTSNEWGREMRDSFFYLFIYFIIIIMFYYFISEYYY